MRLANVLAGITQVEASLGSLEIGGISIDSRKTRPGDLFVAIRGERADGHSFLDAAARAGAATALVERDISPPPLPLLRVASTSAVLPAVAVRFYGDPSASLAVIGVTGTNGKTTVTYLLESILEAAGIKAAVIGSINYRLAGEVLRTGLTTPFPHELQEVMAAAVSAGASHFVMEVSSHSTAQGRVEGVRFDAGLFTNLSHDHLDFHGDMESYFQAKARFFREFLPAGGKRAGMAVNEGTRLSLATPVGPLDLRAKIVGGVNASNIMAAVCGAILLGVPPGAIRDGVEKLPAIPGRMEEIPNDRGIHIVVDYAHTPDGLDRLLTSLGELAEGRLITVFGCGGDRDRAKRPEMGRIATRRSDVVIITSDNPRNEDPEAILSDISPGVVAEGYREAKEPVPWDEGYFVVIPDRKSAIARALEIARQGDTVAVAGKGHENVQLIGDRRLPFDDRETIRAILTRDG
jgi:UDP-N-acetylmuramoyl-L-alanyl-D-glutamate--2,6-diaminopimelate ligase